MILMEMNYKTIGKVEGVFRESWERVSSGAIPVCVPPYDSKPNAQDIWVYYMNSHDVTIVDSQNLMESFADMVNFGHLVNESVCVLNPAEEGSFLLIPDELAERVLVMGTLA